MQYGIWVEAGAGREGDDSLVVTDMQRRVKMNSGKQVPVFDLYPQWCVHGDHSPELALLRPHSDAMQSYRLVARGNALIRPDSLPLVVSAKS
jgi:hypothetical protein